MRHGSAGHPRIWKCNCISVNQQEKRGMDPNETLSILIEAAVEGEIETFKEAASELAAWMEKGGFSPGPGAAWISSRRLGYNPLGGEHI